MNDQDPIDALLRTHFAGRLDRQRGRAEAAFEREISRPATLSFARAERRRPFRVAGGVGLALAASIALGFAVPSLFNRSTGGESIGKQTGGVIERTNVVRDSWGSYQDQGPVMIDPSTPGRQLLQRRVERVRWTDAEGKEHVEYVVPSDQRVVVEQPKQ